MTTKAVILAAGLGSRLHPLTEDTPKCLTEIDGKPLLHHQIEALQKNGVTDILVIIGYLGYKVVKALAGYSGVDYRMNPDYATTGTVYSLWLASAHLMGGCYIVEGDVMFEPSVVPMLQSKDGSTWAVRKAEGGDDGCVVSVSDGIVQTVDLLKTPIRECPPHKYKSQGIIKVDADTGHNLAHLLSMFVEYGGGVLFKDEVIECLDDIAIVDITGKKCYEIDTKADLLKAEKALTHTKYVVVIMDGAADDPVVHKAFWVDGKGAVGETPFEYAQTPGLDSLASGGKVGLIQTMFPHLPLGSIVAMLGLLGYNPMRYYPDGRASFEAIGQDIYLDDEETAFRCNLVRLGGDGRIADATPAVSHHLFEDFTCSSRAVKFIRGRSYRNLVIVRDGNGRPDCTTTFPPHESVGRPIRAVYPIGGETSTLCGLIDESIEYSDYLKSQKQIRDDYALLPWSPSTMPHLPSFHGRHGIDGAIVSAEDFMVGIAKAARLEWKRTPDMTGFSDTNLEAKLVHVKNSLRYNDIVFVHVNAPDEESHAKNTEGKIGIIERIDGELIGPLREHLDAHYPGNYRLAVLPDHYTYVVSGRHGDKPVPYVIYGAGVEPSGIPAFSEWVQSKHVLKSYEFMDFLRGG